MKYILIICIAFILLTSCSGWNPVPVLINETNSTIRFSYDRHSKYDTLPNLTYCNETDLYYICPFTKQPFREQANWNSYFKAHPENKLSIYIINEDSLLKYGTCEILKKQIFMKRFDLTYDDLKKLNWKVVFDGK